MVPEAFITFHALLKASITSMDYCNASKDHKSTSNYARSANWLCFDFKRRLESREIALELIVAAHAFLSNFLFQTSCCCLCNRSPSHG